MPTTVILGSYIIRIEDGVVTNSGAITDASIAAVLSDATIAGVLSEATIDGAKANISTGKHIQFTGNGGANRAIAHGLGVKPTLDIIQKSTGGTTGIQMADSSILLFAIENVVTALAVTAKDDTNIYVPTNLNSNGINYKMAVFV